MECTLHLQLLVCEGSMKDSVKMRYFLAVFRYIPGCYVSKGYAVHILVAEKKY